LTGAAFYLGSLLVAWWLIAMAQGPTTYQQFEAFIGSTPGRVGHPLVAIPLLLLGVSRTWHMRVGMQLIFEHYVHENLLKVPVLALNNLFSAAVAISAAYAVLN
jgi:succinate dehydrogenase hydrophobic membrane anchor protein